MILGYPGRTNRYMTSYEVNEQLQIVHPDRIKIRGIKQDIWMKDMRQTESKYSVFSKIFRFIKLLEIFNRTESRS